MTSEQRFESAYRAHYRDVAAYCQRRCATPDDAEEAATEVFAIAWRRIDSLPGEVRPWLFGVARRVIANQRRGERRRARLTSRLREQHVAVAAEAGAGRAVTALASLSQDDRELLLLSAWEELTPREIAGVLDVPAPVVSTRLYRARRRFAAALALALTLAAMLLVTLPRGPDPQAAIARTAAADSGRVVWHLQDAHGEVTTTLRFDGDDSSVVVERGGVRSESRSVGGRDYLLRGRRWVQTGPARPRTTGWLEHLTVTGATGPEFEAIVPASVLPFAVGSGSLAASGRIADGHLSHLELTAGETEITIDYSELGRPQGITRPA